MNEFSQKLQTAKLNVLKQNAMQLPEPIKEWKNIEELCMAMAEASRNQIVKSSFNGQEFVVAKNTPPDKAVEAWVNQCLNFNNDSYETLAEHMQINQNMNRHLPKSHNLDSQEIIQTKVAETLLTKFPEQAQDLDTIQLVDVYYNNPLVPGIEEKLKKSVNRYMNGEDTFEASIHNLSKVHKLEEFMYHSGMCSSEEIDNRIAQTEIKMLEGLDIK